MLQPLDQFVTKRFKNTLAVFKSYCQKKNQSLEQFKHERDGFNSSMTKYQSIRELRKKEEHCKDKNLDSPRKQTAAAAHNRCEQPPLELRHSDLIEIIKLKLHESHHKNVHFNTEYGESQVQFKCYPRSKRSRDRMNITNNSIVSKGFKKKHIDLVVKNSYYKMKPKQRTQRNMSSEEIIVNLKQRPCSAMAQITLKGDQKESSRMKTSPSRHKFSQIIGGTHRKTTNTETNLVFQTEAFKDLSGWQITGYQQEEFPSDMKGPYKRSTKRRSKMNT